MVPRRVVAVQVVRRGRKGRKGDHFGLQMAGENEGESAKWGRIVWQRPLILTKTPGSAAGRGFRLFRDGVSLGDGRWAEASGRAETSATRPGPRASNASYVIASAAVPGSPVSAAALAARYFRAHNRRTFALIHIAVGMDHAVMPDWAESDSEYAPDGQAAFRSRNI